MLKGHLAQRSSYDGFDNCTTFFIQQMDFVDNQQFQALALGLKIKQETKEIISNRDQFSFSSWLSCHNVPFFWRCHNYLGACDFGPRQLHIALNRKSIKSARKDQPHQSVPGLLSKAMPTFCLVFVQSLRPTLSLGH